MSQPSNQREHFPALGELDHDAGEFWMENPWKEDGNNLSAYERNRVLLNLGESRFIDASHIIGADLDSDSRGVVCADFTGDGMPDVLIRSSGGGPLRLFENRFPKQNWLRLSLDGTKSNRLGVGALIRLKSGENEFVRRVFPHNGFCAQAHTSVEFGLSKLDKLDELTITWPSGAKSRLTDITSNQHLVVIEPIPDMSK